MLEQESPLQTGKDIRDLDYEIESVRANLDYLNDNIRECQALIVQVEDIKDNTECLELHPVLEGMGAPQGWYTCSSSCCTLARNPESAGSTEQNPGSRARSQTVTDRG
ncbi:hypothetical protein HPB51_028461 [Rhipicephalus microplus]|uniref:KIF21A/B second helical domain-containing protein n=1 Tax=Rhipicephalus microplus TaxID=6941 RepID=A0A9J6CWU7_RHIMP|nr:hypothetical protein HPB51_028461 [Rhipicephalus microplus]